METTINATQLVLSHHNPKWWTGLWNRDEFDGYEKIAWMQRNWMISIYAAIIYVVAIFGLREWMKDRRALELRVPLIIWNSMLALLSIKGALTGLPTVLRIITTRGFHGSVCTPFIDLLNDDEWYWGTLFVFSKIIELGDTFFIVFRKRPLIFLHWYHHISVLVFTWITHKEMMSTGGWAGMMNFTVHAFMYTYFTITAIGWKVPKPIAMSITAVQLLQMIVNLGIHSYAAEQKIMGDGCTGVSDLHLWLAFGLFSSYAILFGKFFYKAYLGGGSRKKVD